MALVLLQDNIVLQKPHFTVHPYPDIAVLLQLGERFLPGALLFPYDRCQDHEPGTVFVLPYCVHHLGYRHSGDGNVMVRAVGNACAGIEQTQVVVDLRYRTYRGAGIVRRCFLVYGDGRREPFDGLHVRFVHPAQEHTGIGAQGFDIPSLSLSVDRIKGQGRLSATGQSCHDHHTVLGDIQGDVLQVIFLRSVDPDLCLFHQ